MSIQVDAAYLGRGGGLHAHLARQRSVIDARHESGGCAAGRAHKHTQRRVSAEWRVLVRRRWHMARAEAELDREMAELEAAFGRGLVIADHYNARKIEIQQRKASLLSLCIEALRASKIRKEDDDVCHCSSPSLPAGSLFRWPRR